VILVDTSVWIDVLRARKPLDLEALVSFDDVATCLPVIQEVLQGIGDERAFQVARESLTSLPVVESPMSLDLVEQAVGLYRTARRAGFTVRSSVDCLIAACALRHDLEVLHRDRDYDAIARISGLRVRRC
jgi:predicted nucleic acid-binding protein